jgi:transposase
VGALVVPASTHENRVSELMLEHLTPQGVTGRLELVLVDRGVTAAAARALGRHHDLQLRRVGWDDKQPVFRPIGLAWRVEVAHGRLGRFRRLAKSFQNTTASATGRLQVACIATTLRHLSRARAHRRGLARAA